MTDAGEVVSDRQLVASLIRTTEKAAAANKRLLEELKAEESGEYRYLVNVAQVQPGDLVWHSYAWRTVVAVDRLADDSYTVFFDTDGFKSRSAFPTYPSGSHVDVRRPRGERAA